MSKREIERAGVLEEVAAGRMKQERAAEVLKLSGRQIKRLLKAYRIDGAAALRSNKRGRPSNRRSPQALREQVLALEAERYSDFGPTLLAEYLAREHAIDLSTETVRQWLMTAGRWKAKVKRRSIHPPRNRRPRFGELIQIDGSPHDWFEGRAPRCTMIVFIDDATSQVLHARLVPAETTQAYFDGMAEHLLTHGRPLAYYSDKHSIFRVNREDADSQLTQVGRALKTLDIELICAHSPQAKGRVERVHQTFQDRFTKALRVAHIHDMQAANAYLETYLVEHNQRFAKPAFDKQDAHRPLAQSEPDLRRTLSPHHIRRVDRNGTIQFDKHALKIAPTHQRRTLGKRLTVVIAGQQIELWSEQTPIPFIVLDLTTWRAQVKDRKALDAQLDRQQKLKPITPTKPSPMHPWKKPFISQEATT